MKQIKGLLLVLGMAVTLQPLSAATLYEKFKDGFTPGKNYQTFTTLGIASAAYLKPNKATTAAAYGLAGCLAGKAGNIIFNHFFTPEKLPFIADHNDNNEYIGHTESNMNINKVNKLIKDAEDITKHNFETRKNIADDTTLNLINLGTETLVARGSITSKTAFNTFCLMNSFNFYRSAQSVANDTKKYFSNLNFKNAALTTAYVGAAVAGALLPKYLCKDNMVAQASLKYLSRAYLRNQILGGIAGRGKVKDYNKSLADVVDMGLTALTFDWKAPLMVRA